MFMSPAWGDYYVAFLASHSCTLCSLGDITKNPKQHCAVLKIEKEKFDKPKSPL